MDAKSQYDISMVKERSLLASALTLTLPHKLPEWKQIKDRLTKFIADENTPKRFLFYLKDLIKLRYGKKEKIQKDVLENLLQFLQKYKVDYHKIALLALRIEELFPLGIIPLSIINEENIFVFKDIEIACIIACSFYCIMKPYEDKNMSGDFNFLVFYNALQDPTTVIAQKLLCYFQYFNDYKEEGRVISVHRYCKKLKTLEDWESSTKLGKIQIVDKGRMEEEPKECVIVDFANKYISGGAMTYGLVQEEILFLIFPELLITIAICQKQNQNESIVINGPKRYSDYTGYSKSFKFAGPHKDHPELDEFGRLKTHFLAIDAKYIQMKSLETQFNPPIILRELNKAFAGFSTSSKFPICTGNWGCGAFHGCKQLKFLLQWMAASMAQVDLIYYTFADAELVNAQKVVDTLKDKEIKDIFAKIKELKIGNYDEMTAGLFSSILGGIAKQ